MEERFKEAIALMHRADYRKIADRLHKELAALHAAAYRIAVIGEFKAGKSTLINLVFLKDNILFTDVMEATAVPTEIGYGEEGRLEITPYKTGVYS